VDGSEKQNGTGRVNGKFAPGVSGNPKGRPRGIDFRKVAEERSAAAGTNLEHELYEVLAALIAQAKKGDATAAKLVLDRLCDAVPSKVEHSGGFTLAEMIVPPSEAEQRA
jgi:hypothetical protein